VNPNALPLRRGGGNARLNLRRSRLPAVASSGMFGKPARDFVLICTLAPYVPSDRRPQSILV